MRDNLPVISNGTRSRLVVLSVLLALIAAVLAGVPAGHASAQGSPDSDAARHDIVPILPDMVGTHPLVSFDSRQLPAPSQSRPAAGDLDELFGGSLQERRDRTFQDVETHPTLPITFITLPGFNMVFVVDSGSGNLLLEIPVIDEPDAIAFSPDGQIVYFSSRSTASLHVLQMADLFVGATDLISDLPIPNPAIDIEIGADGRIWVLARFGIYAVSPETGERVTKKHTAYTEYSGEIEINAQGTKLFYGNTGSSPATFAEFAIAGAGLVLVYEAPFGDVGANGQDIELSPDGSTIVFMTGTGQGGSYQTALYNTDGYAIAAMLSTEPYPRAVAYSPDGLWIYTAHTEGIIDVWRASAPYDKVASFEFASGTAIEIHAEPSGQMIYVLSDDDRAYPIATNTFRQGVKLCGGGVVNVDIGEGQMPTDGPDVIMGTAGDDTIDVGGGFFNMVCALDGDDTLVGGPGRNLFYGGLGNDAMTGGPSADFFFGQEGNDKLYGRNGGDVLDGGDGDDVLHGDKGADLLDGGEGADRMFGYADDDTLEGGPGDDRMHGNFGNDVINGGPGHDRIFGYGDDDMLDGGAGNDIIGGNRDDDVINGGPGNDRLYGSDGSDTVSGGLGNDKVEGNSGTDIVNGGDGDDTLDGGINRDTCDGGEGVDTASRCETELGIP